MEIKIINKSSNPLPEYATPGSSGLDIRADLKSSLVIKPMERILIPTGLYLEIPRGFEIQIRPRSGLAMKQGLSVLNSPGTIDSDYRGEVKVIIINLSAETHKIESGDRIAQMVVAPVVQANISSVDLISESERGSGGFGHTGIQ
ncbi:MAG: dUTP diphosphatase [Chitinophagales bacterium]|nr:dUTP diphosphatase [Chitinophagales bacterium]